MDAMKDICTVEDCYQPERSVGLCESHYQMKRRRGTTERMNASSKYTKPCEVFGCQSKHKGLGYCRFHLSNLLRFGDPLAVVSDNFEAFFWHHVAITADPARCWHWLGYTKGTMGYGCIRYQGRAVLAHRLSWMIANGRWPVKNVLHSCDNAICVNPSHLREGTQKENAQDMLDRGRCHWQKLKATAEGR